MRDGANQIQSPRLPVLIIQRPQELWFATAADQLVPADPDITDGKIRPYSLGEVNWREIAKIMTAVSRKLLQAGMDGQLPGRLRIDLSPIRETPRPGDIEVLRQWFGPQEVMGDPSFQANGRHRLWKSWAADPDAVLPIRSKVRAAAPDLPPEITRLDKDSILRDAPSSVWHLNSHYRRWLESTQ